MTHSTAHKHDSPRTPRATYQDVLDAPEHRVAEIVDGTLYILPLDCAGASLCLCSATAPN